MPARAILNHTSTYSYDGPATLGPHVVRLRPAPHTKAAITDYELRITPAAHVAHWQQDPLSNWQARIVFSEPVRELKVEVSFAIEGAATNPFDFLIEPDAALLPLSYDPGLADVLAPYLAVEPSAALDDFVATLSATGAATLDVLVGLNARIRNDFAYRQRFEQDTQSPEQTLSKRAGSCRDFAWLFVHVLRRIGVAARFVSGYALNLEGVAKLGQDAAELHAWAEAYLPGAGWIGFDPTAGLLAGEGHVPLAVAAHYDQAAPIAGTADRPAAHVTFSIEVTPVGADAHKSSAHIDKPNQESRGLSDAEWARLDALGAAIDADMRAQGMRLTMGGEPTFVAAENQDAPEWNVAAIGPDKAEYGNRMLRRLQARFAPHGFLHHGSGKQYPGEPLPRWAYSLLWRKDGKTVWRDPARMGRDEAKPATPDDARRLADALAAYFVMAPESVIAAYEDPHYWQAYAASVPVNLEPGDPRHKSTAPVGFVLPLHRTRSDLKPSPWRSEVWTLRREKLFLLPGDGSIGDRLPLASLPALEPDDFPYLVMPDPTEELEPLVDRYEALRQAAPAGAARTAMTIEPREGRLCVFLPPVERLEHYFELLAAIETCAADLDVALRLEGYKPPADPRIGMLSVTPDPGVVEVNVHPAATWAEAVAITDGVYEDAEAVGMRADKFYFDGRHMSCGGGSHIVFGGATPNESPFLLRPDLLKSVLTYWQRHPSLSYFFSGQYVGPSSQSPRIDEARHEALYELEIALARIPAPGAEPAPPPWAVDRLLRNLLVDASGNTHRAEICIDKLYSPHGPMGRLGLVELRAFEMPPNARMALAQQALLRALITWFWRAPLDAPLQRWGTALADRFMLSEFVWADLLAVLEALSAAGYAFDPAWFEPQRAFRFPILGEVQCADASFTLRHALEPWHALADDSGSGSARMVDSSLARVEISADGFDPERHVVACNGRRAPMTETSRAGRFAAGVRFKAWKQEQGLHPTLDPHAPLRFDIFDLRAGKAAAAFSYSVMSDQPGRPVSVEDARARRRARFMVAPLDPAKAPPPAERDAEFPTTLDLRRPGAA